MYTGYFTNVTYTENEVNELGSEAEALTRLQRRQRRIKHEDEKWDEEYYIDEALTRLGGLIKNATMTKQSVGWELEQLEGVVRQIQAGEQRELDSDDE
ncbi:hypothetical protein HHX47_DHR1000746 [Lentinula edodes]|nr:hypothetical protein HHX47_DHR1000746 [Lentinula edodes]